MLGSSSKVEVEGTEREPLTYAREVGQDEEQQRTQTTPPPPVLKAPRRTYEVIFSSGTLGIDMQEHSPSGVYMVRDRRPQLSSAGVPLAERSGDEICLGDRLVQVGEVDVRGSGNALVRDLIVATPRPVKLVFEHVPEEERPPIAIPVAIDETSDAVRSCHVRGPCNVVYMDGLPPPTGARPGGYYTRENYCGPLSWIIGVFMFWPIVFCPVDSVMVYREPETGRRYIID